MVCRPVERIIGPWYQLKLQGGAVHRSTLSLSHRDRDAPRLRQCESRDLRDGLESARLAHFKTVKRLLDE